jgi:hypothetical protein
VLVDFYAHTQAWGALLLMVFLRRAELETLCINHPSATPSELLLLLREGIQEHLSPTGHARQRLWSEARSVSRERIRGVKSKQSAPSDPSVALDFARAWAALSAADRALLQRITLPGSVAEIGFELGISEAATEERIRAARSRLRRLMGEI